MFANFYPTFETPNLTQPIKYKGQHGRDLNFSVKVLKKCPTELTRITGKVFENVEKPMANIPTINKTSWLEMKANCLNEKDESTVLGMTTYSVKKSPLEEFEVKKVSTSVAYSQKDFDYWKQRFVDLETKALELSGGSRLAKASSARIDKKINESLSPYYANLMELSKNWTIDIKCYPSGGGCDLDKSEVHAYAMRAEMTKIPAKYLPDATILDLVREVTLFRKDKKIKVIPNRGILKFDEQKAITIIQNFIEFVVKNSHQTKLPPGNKFPDLETLKSKGRI